MTALRQYSGKQIDFYYFSGTGNTLLVVKEMFKVFRENKFEVECHRIEETDPQSVDINNIIGLGFPVAAQGTYPFVWEFIKNLPAAKGTPLFMIDTMLMYSGGIVGPVGKIISRKGYIPVGAKEFRRPSNVFLKEGMNAKKREKINKVLIKANEFARKLIDGKTGWFDLPVYADLLALISQKNSSWNFFRSLTPNRVDKSKCVACGLCASLCSVNNIDWRSGLKFRGNCVLCMRCFAYCPEEAIGFKNYGSARYSAVTADELVSVISNCMLN